MKKRHYLWLENAVLIGAAACTLVFFLSWWLQDGRLRSPMLVLVLIAAIVYIVVQMIGSWVLNLAARRLPPAPQPSPKRTVDVFVTAYHEPAEMVQAVLVAALAMRGATRVWLLDDGGDPVLCELARQLGCGYLTRSDNRNAKAGNINAALPRTDGEVIAIFDTDHVPQPDFLEKSLGYFEDPQVGFVQVMLTFRNYEESWVARSATESSLEFYNPTYLGAQRLGAATLMGSNALIRRTALLSIDGYQPGLAEDLATSLALHTAGWRSAYVAEPLAPGLSPSSLAAWSVQQMKWARGVFELLHTKLPLDFGRLTWGQRISYMVRMTKYWIGPAVFVHLTATVMVLFFADAPARAAFHSYLNHLAPLLMMDVLFRAVALRRFRPVNYPKSSLFGAIVLVYASWPTYLFAWLLALLRLPLRFRPTPKSGDDSLNVLWLLPQIIALGLLVFGLYYTVVVQNHPVSLVLAAALVQALFQLALLLRWVQEDRSVRAHARRVLRPFRKVKYAYRNS